MHRSKVLDNNDDVETTVRGGATAETHHHMKQRMLVSIQVIKQELMFEALPSTMYDFLLADRNAFCFANARLERECCVVFGDVQFKLSAS